MIDARSELAGRLVIAAIICTGDQSQRIEFGQRPGPRIPVSIRTAADTQGIGFNVPTNAWVVFPIVVVV